jgi:hypothetical protein
LSVATLICLSLFSCFSWFSTSTSSSSLCHSGISPNVVSLTFIGIIDFFCLLFLIVFQFIFLRLLSFFFLPLHAHSHTYVFRFLFVSLCPIISISVTSTFVGARASAVDRIAVSVTLFNRSFGSAQHFFYFVPFLLNLILLLLFFLLHPPHERTSTGPSLLFFSLFPVLLLSVTSTFCWSPRVGLRSNRNFRHLFFSP